MRLLFYTVIVSLCVVFALSSCKKHAPKDVIFVDEPEEVIDTSTVDVGTLSLADTLKWGGAPCVVSMKRTTDKERSLVRSEGGRKYYDTRIVISVINKEGKTFFERAFTKEDFLPYVAGRWKKDGVLLGLRFTEIEGGNLLFRGSVGDPDPLNDDFDPVLLYIDRSARFRMAHDDKPDMYYPSDEEEI